MAEAREGEADINGILERAIVPDGARYYLDWVREVMTEAWQFGYTAGMADSAKLEQILE